MWAIHLEHWDNILLDWQVMGTHRSDTSLLAWEISLHNNKQSNKINIPYMGLKAKVFFKSDKKRTRLTHVIFTAGVASQIPQKACEWTQLHCSLSVQKFYYGWDNLFLLSKTRQHPRPLQVQTKELSNMEQCFFFWCDPVKNVTDPFVSISEVLKSSGSRLTSGRVNVRRQQNFMVHSQDMRVPKPVGICWKFCSLCRCEMTLVLSL